MKATLEENELSGQHNVLLNFKQKRDQIFFVAGFQ